MLLPWLACLPHWWRAIWPTASRGIQLWSYWGQQLKKGTAGANWRTSSLSLREALLPVASQCLQQPHWWAGSTPGDKAQSCHSLHPCNDDTGQGTYKSPQLICVYSITYVYTQLTPIHNIACHNILIFIFTDYFSCRLPCVGRSCISLRVKSLQWMRHQRGPQNGG